MRIKHH